MNGSFLWFVIIILTTPPPPILIEERTTFRNFIFSGPLANFKEILVTDNLDQGKLYLPSDIIALSVKPASYTRKDFKILDTLKIYKLGTLHH